MTDRLPYNPRIYDYSAAAGQKHFPVAFPYQEDADVSVLVLEGDDFRKLSLGADYSLNEQQVILNVGLAAATVLRVKGTTVLARKLSVVQSGRLNSRNLDTELDRAWMTLQELQRDNQDTTRRSMQVPFDEEIGPLPSAEERAGRVSAFDGDGNPISGPRFVEISNAQANAEAAQSSASFAVDAMQAARNAQDAAEGAAETVVVGRYNSLAGAAAAELHMAIQSVKLTGFREAGDGGKSLYKCATHEPPHAGKFLSKDGRWWELSDALATPKQFGAVSDANFKTGEGTDSTAAIDQWLAFTSLTSGVCRLDGKYKYVGQLSIPSNIEIKTDSAQENGFVIEIGNEESGLVVESSNVIIGDLTISRNLKEPIVGKNAGNFGNIVRLGNYLDGAQEPMQNLRFGNLNLVSVDGSEQGQGLTIFGRVSSVSAGDVTVSGNVSLAFQAHWSGNITEVGQAVTESYHPHDIHIRKIEALSSCNFGVVLSSVYNITIDKIYGEQLEKGFYWLAGDETNDFDVEQSGLVGRGVEIGHAVFEGTSAGQSYFIECLGHGASKFRVDGLGNPLQKNLPIGLKIGNLIVHGSDNINDCFETLNATGSIVVENSVIRGFKRYSVFLLRSLATTRFLNMDHIGEVRALRSANCKFSGKISESGDGSYGFYIYGEMPTSTLSADISFGDTSISVVQGFPYDILRGDRFLIGSFAFTASEFVESGVTTIPIIASRKTIVSGVEVMHDLRAVNVEVSPFVEGATTGVRVVNGHVGFENALILDASRYGINLSDSIVTIKNPRIAGTGFIEGPTNYDVVIDNSNVTIIGGKIGDADGITDKHLDINGSSSVVVSLGVQYGDAAKIQVIEPEAISEFFACYDTNGNQLS
ncbi:hypothetical protein SAMN05444141_102676 [Pseudovibrio denitrificans]|uniref:Uncharacterized protein n=2 Tax=Pseudovibrio denitrificans TaxID=258256 RepID=A0A1I6ZX16_9HYPH|nr:hypothetical protein [Pseudovibrio denitrificans]SFT67213.1 hypothetical protein SAMN05444141_102676 [Pseudovibrio denitrificans]